MKINFAKILRELGVKYGVKFLASLTGLKGWLANVLLKKLYKLAVELLTDVKETKHNEKTKEAYEENEKLNKDKPIGEIDEKKRSQLEDDMLNGRPK